MSITSERLAQLNSGQDASSNLAEGLAVDFAALMAAALPQVQAAALEKMRQAASWGISKRMVLAGEVMLDAVGRQGLMALAGHQADTVRGWVCYALAHDHALRGPAEPLENLLDAMRVFADDVHFGVREWVWLAVRPHIAAQPQRAIGYLAGWATAPSERVRRFADILMQAGIVTTTRKTRGDDIDAACGQLAGQVKDKTRRTAGRTNLHTRDAERLVRDVLRCQTESHLSANR